MLKKNLKRICLGLIIIFVFSLFINATFASDTELKFKEYSDRYKEWLELTVEEREKVVQPAMFSTEYTPQPVSFFSTLKSSATDSITKFNLKDKINITIKDQMNTQLCYALSVVSSLETNLALKGETMSFSARHIHYAITKTFTDGINTSGHNKELGQGGNDVMVLAYLTRGDGPILESEMPFENNETKKPLSYIKNKNTVKKVDEYIFFPEISKSASEQTKKEFRNMIKEHIYNYGSVTGGMVIPSSSSETTEYFNKYYNESNAATYYTGSALANHEVSIVGWDDNYAVSNFLATNRPSKPGAFIVRNSYGTTWGDNGYQYVSYEDTSLTADMSGAVKISNINYDNIYVYDELGANAGVESAYGINVFNRKSSKLENLTEVGLYFFEKTNYEIYVNSTDGSLADNKFVKVKSGTYTNGAYGYTSVKLDSPVLLTGSKFAIKIKYMPLNAVPYVPIECKNDVVTWNTVTSNPGESYVWFNNSWADLSTITANACIKAFTKNAIDHEIFSSKYIIGDDLIISRISNETTVEVFKNNVTTTKNLKIFNKNSVQMQNSDIIGTGMKLLLDDNIEYELTVTGDVSGSGLFTITDMSKMISHLVGINILTGPYVKALDVNFDGSFTITDASIMRKAIVSNTKF